MLRTAFDLPYFLDIARIIAYDVAGILWMRVWKGKVHGGLLVNAALCNNKGMVVNEPQVIDL